MASSTLTIRVDDDLKREAAEVADYYGLDLSSVTRAFFKQMVNTHRIPLTFAPEEPNAESLEAIREGDAFLASGKKGRFGNGRRSYRCGDGTMSTLTAEFSAAFSRDLKKKARRRKWDLSELQKLIDLVLQNTPESMDILKRRHNMHRLSGNWAGRNECHVANSGDWLVIWSSNEEVAFFERTGSHDELFR